MGLRGSIHFLRGITMKPILVTQTDIEFGLCQLWQLAEGLDTFTGWDTLQRQLSGITSVLWLSSDPIVGEVAGDIYILIDIVRTRKFNIREAKK